MFEGMRNIVDNIAEGWENLRISSEYTRTQRDSLKALQKVFLQCFNQETKGTLLESNENHIPLQANDFLIGQLEKARKPERIVSDSPLCGYANSLLLDIAQYLNKRDSGHFNPSYANDPMHLFCLQLNEWISHRLMRAECKKDTLSEVKMWINYLGKILNERVFSYCERVDALDTLNITISNMRNILQNVHDYIELELSRTTIEKELTSLLNCGKNYVNLSFSYLLYVLNDRKNIPCNFSIENINISDLELIPEIKEFVENTHLGLCLALLAQAPAIRELFVPSSSKSSKNIQVQTQLSKTTKSFQEKTQALVKKEEEGKTLFLSPEGEGERRVIELLYQSTLMDNVSAGLFDFKSNISHPTWDAAKNQTDAIQHFVKCCGLLDVFAQILLHCREAAYLSGKTGDLLLCKLTKQQLRFLTESFEQLADLIQKEMLSLNHITHDLNGALNKGNKKQLRWQHNYHTANQLFEKIETLYKSEDSFFSHTKTIDTSIKTLNKQIEETHDRLIGFVNGINRTASNQYWLAPSSELRKLPQNIKFPLMLGNGPSISDELPKITYGTLQSKKNNLFPVKIDDVKTYLQPIAIPQSPDCLFHALEIDREETIEHLLAVCTENEDLWKLVVPEIKMTYKNKALPSSYAFLESYATYNQTKSHELLEQYCRDAHFVAYFINDYYLKEKNGVTFQENHTSVLDAIVKFKELKLFVWKEEKGKLKLLNHHNKYSKSSNPPKHLLWLPHGEEQGFSGFQALLDLQYPWSESSLLSTAAFFNLETKVLFSQAKLLEERGDYEEAVKNLNILISREPENGLLFLMRGRNLMQTNANPQRRLGLIRLGLKDFTLALDYSFDNDLLTEKILILQKEAFNMLNEDEAVNSSIISFEKTHSIALTRENGNLENQLLQAAKQNNLEDCQHFINQGASLTVQNSQGCTILHLCSSPVLIKLFLENGAKNILELKNKNGETALYYHTHIACVKAKVSELDVNNAVEIVELLLEAGANVNVDSSNKKGPLFLATKDKLRTNERLIELLMNYGANIRARDNKGDYAMGCSSGHAGIFDQFSSLSRYTDELLGDQAAKGAQAYNIANQHEAALEQMEEMQRKFEAEVKKLKEENQSIKKQMQILLSTVRNKESRVAENSVIQEERKTDSYRFFPK